MATPDDFVGPVNVGDPIEFSILELAQKVMEMTGSKSRIVFKPLPSDDPMRGANGTSGLLGRGCGGAR